MARLEMEEEEDAEEKGAQEEKQEPLGAFIDTYFEDTDFAIIFEDRYDGIDETEVAKVLGMSSLALVTGFCLFLKSPRV